MTRREIERLTASLRTSQKLSENVKQSFEDLPGFDFNKYSKLNIELQKRTQRYSEAVSKANRELEKLTSKNMNKFTEQYSVTFQKSLNKNELSGIKEVLEKYEHLTKLNLIEIYPNKIPHLHIQRIGRAYRNELKLNVENEQLLKFDFDSSQESKQRKSFKFTVYANKLPKGICGFIDDEELQAYCIELRKVWYENKLPNFWTHLVVWLKTWHFVITEFIYKQSIANIYHRFQPLNKPQLPKELGF